METMILSLDEIGRRCGTDKSSAHHNYCVIYEKYFEKYRNEPISIIEAGFGGYEHFDRGGQSVRMWLEYFTQAKIVSFDIYPKDVRNLDPDRFQYLIGDQTNAAFLSELCSAFTPDIFIDDASHINPHTIATFQAVWPHLKSDGIYVIEDLETSYWPTAAGDGQEYLGGELNPGSVMNILKRLCDSINHGHSEAPDYGIKSINFWRQIVFIVKK